MADPDAATFLEDLRPLLLDLMTQTGTPGASVGLLSPSGIDVLHAGVGDLANATPVTASTLFEIGSITKVWTATALLRLIDRQLLTLETPVRDVVPDLPRTETAVTVGQLLSHTAGLIDQPFDGLEEATNRQVVAQLAAAAVGTAGSWTYSNIGYILLGRVLEEIVGLSLPEALQTEVLEPAGVRSARIVESGGPRAVGHQPDGTGGLMPEQPGRFPGYAACGSTPVATADALLRTIYPHMHEGLGMDGSRVLSAQAVHDMQGWHAEVPPNAERKAGWGLGWTHYRLQDGRTILGHGGSTFGFLSYLVAVPHEQIAIAILANSAGAVPLLQQAGDRLLRELVGSPLYG